MSKDEKVFTEQSQRMDRTPHEIKTSEILLDVLQNARLKIKEAGFHCGFASKVAFRPMLEDNGKSAIHVLVIGTLDMDFEEPSQYNVIAHSLSQLSATPSPKDIEEANNKTLGVYQKMWEKQTKEDL
jgi:hypothetical protein